MILPKLQSRFDKIEALVKGKGFAASDVSLRGVGSVKKFPAQSLDRFVLQGSQEGDLIAYAGMTTTAPLRAGSSFLPYTSVFNLESPATFQINGKPLGADQAGSLGAQLDSPAQDAVAATTDVLLTGYTLRCEGTYPAGSRAITVLSKVPVLRGDQWIVWSTQNGRPISHSTTIQNAFKTSHPDQWDVQVLDPIPVTLDHTSRILVQASSAVQWDDIPLTKGPCWLSLPIATHLQDSQALMVAYVRLKSSDRVLIDYFTFDPILTISLAPIPPYMWSNARVTGGVADFQVGATLLKPLDGLMSSRITFESPLEGDLMGILRISIQTDLPGRLYFKYDNGDAVFDLQPGIQTLTLPVHGNISFMDISNDTEILLGEISPKTIATSVDVSLHIFGAEGLASHVFQRPTLIGLLRDPSLTWSREKLSASNAGYRIHPGQRLWRFSEGLPPLHLYTPYLPNVVPPPAGGPPFLLIQSSGSIGIPSG